MVGAAQDVRHAHVDVVDHHAEVIGRHAVGAQQDEVLDLGVGELDAAEDGVLECGAAAFGYGEANGSAFAGFNPLLSFVARKIAADIARDAAFGDALRRAAVRAALCRRSNNRRDRC